MTWSAAANDFQYPLRVEVGCNTTALARSAIPYIFSVPSTGRSGLQLDGRKNRKVYTIFFQYPLRVEVGCNVLDARRRLPNTKFSVPSTGRSGLQRALFVSAGKQLAVFSTLYGSKWVATLSLEAGRLVDELFSVPSTGRSGLQPPYPIPPERRAEIFSTLYGSKWVATLTHSDNVRV